MVLSPNSWKGYPSKTDQQLSVSPDDGSFGLCSSVRRKSRIYQRRILRNIRKWSRKLLCLKSKKKEALLKESFVSHFSLENLVKDLNYAEELFKTFSGIALEGALVKELYKIGINLGLKEKDFSAIYQVLKKLTSLTIKTKKGGDMIKNEVFAALRGIWEITEKDIIFDVLGLTEEERKEVFNLPKISFADEKKLIFSEVSCII